MSVNAAGAIDKKCPVAEPANSIRRGRQRLALASGLKTLATDSIGNLYVGGNVGGSYVGVVGTFSDVIKISSKGSFDPTWNPNFTGTVTALAIDANDSLYAAGFFSKVGGVAHPYLAKVATAGTGSVDPNWSPALQGISGATPRIYTLVADNQNSLYVGGEFSAIGGQSRSNLAKLSTTGSGLADASWDPSPNGAVKSLLVDGVGNLYVGGTFTSIGGATSNNIARLAASLTGAADATWSAPTDNFGTNYVASIALSGSGNIVFGGFFSLISGQPRHSVAVVSTAAGVLGAPVNAIYRGGTINAMAAQSDGGLILGGYFSGAGSLIRSNLLRLRPDGSIDPDWSVDTDAPNSMGVETVVASSDAIYVGGEFTKVGGRPKIGIAKLSTAGTPDASWGAATDAAGGYYGVQALALAPNGSVYLGGDFLSVGGQTRIGLARISSSGVFDTLWNSGANFDAASVSYDGRGRVGAIAVDQDGSVYTSHNDADRGPSLRKYSPDGAGAIDTTWPEGYNGPLYALRLDGQGGLFVAGNYGGLFKLSTSTGASMWPTNYYYSPVSLTTVVSRDVASAVPYAIALDGKGNLFAGGGFIQIGGRTRPFLAKLSADTGVVDPDWNPEADNAVLALESDSKGNLYVGGMFTQLGTRPLASFGVVPEATSSQGVPDNLNQFGWTGAWYNPSTSGQGIMLYTIPGTGSDAGTIFGGWFTFSPDNPGKNRWYALQGPIDRSSKSAALTEFVTYQNSPYYGEAYTGDALLTFSDCNHATLTYQLYDPYPAPSGGPTVGEPVAAGTTDLVRLSSNVLCTPNGDRGDAGDFANSGAWYDSANAPDSGLLFDVDANLGVFFAAWYVSDPYSHQIFNPEIVSNSWYTLQAPFHSGMSSLAAVPIFQISGGKLDYPGPVTRSQVGTADFTFINCNAVTMTYTFTAGASAGNQGTLNLTRGAGKPTSCNP